MSIGTLILILEVLGVLGVATLIFIAGHKQGCWSRRHDYRDGYREGVAVENARWESVTGATFERHVRERTEDVPDVPGPDGWPYAHDEPPATEVLLAQADAALGKPQAPRVPSVAELDQMVAEYEAARAPIVADLTGPDAWHYPGEDDVPTLTGLIVTPPRRDRTGPDWLEFQLAAQDSETAAYLRRVEAEMASFRRGITSGVTR